MKPSCGLCCCCGDWFVIRRRDGMIRVHGDRRGSLCYGSDMPPATPKVPAW